MNGGYRLPGDTLTVIIADESRFIHMQEPVQHRTVQLKLTDEQRRMLALNHCGRLGTADIFESISQCWIEPSK